jgi:acyl-CoA thioester hydrolase
MQEAAFRASAAAGYSVGRYEEMDRVWYVRETDIEYLAPLTYGGKVEIETGVLDFRRVRSRRAYTLRQADSGVTVARAVTDWVFLDLSRQRPVSVPQEMVDAFLPEGAPDSVSPREPFPEAPAPPPGVFRQRRRVTWADLDPAGHVNNAVYLSYLEGCAIQDAISRGWPVSRMLKEAQFAIVARRYRIEYRQPAYLNDELELSTWISDVRRVTAIRHYAIRRVGDDALLARAWARWAWVDPESARPVRIPAAFLEDFAPNIVQ